MGVVELGWFLGFLTVGFGVGVAGGGSWLQASSNDLVAAFSLVALVTWSLGSASQSR